MAEFVLIDASIVVNAIDLSDHCRSITISYNADMIDSSAMKATTPREFLPGLTNWTVAVEWEQDHAASKVDATLFPLIGAASFTTTMKATSSAVSATNPSFAGSTLLQDYNPIAGATGDHAVSSTTLQGTGALTRATS